MSDPKLPPEQWRPLFDKIGVEFGYRPLATRINMDHTKVRRILRGDRTSHEAIKELTDGLGIDPTEVYRLRGEEPVEPFTLPDEAGRLTGSERRVIRAMVQALLHARERDNAVEATTQSDASGEAGPNKKTDAGDPRDNVTPINPNHRGNFTPGIVEGDAAAYEPDGPTDADQFNTDDQPETPPDDDEPR